MQFNLNKTLLIIIGLTLTILIGTRYKSEINLKNNILGSTTPEKAEIQILEVTARGGYTPQEITAKAGEPSILRVKTNNTFDCSSALTIPKLKIRKNLPPTGKTDIEIPAQTKGTKLIVSCSMGMYHFSINFE